MLKIADIYIMILKMAYIWMIVGDGIYLDDVENSRYLFYDLEDGRYLDDR